MQKYGITLPEFESLLKMLIRKGLFTKEEFKTWKTSRVQPQAQSAVSKETKQPDDMQTATQTDPSHIETFILADPEKNHAWVMQLFSTRRDLMREATFKVVLQGKKYLFVVDRLIFRGNVYIMEDQESEKASKSKREEALEFISKHGWAAYLEQRAFQANFDESQAEKIRSSKKARLLLVQCRNNTYLAALHTPAPAISLYVGSSLENMKSRLAKVVDLTGLEMFS